MAILGDKKDSLHKPLLLSILAVVVFALVADKSLRQTLLPHDADALGGYFAVDVLGQVDGANTPYFDSDTQGNSPNAFGANGIDGIAMDTVRHRLFATDDFNNRVLVYNLDSSNRLIDHVADYVIGQPDFKHNSNALARNSLNTAINSGQSGLAYDAANDRLFVVDRGNNRVLVFNTASITNGMDADYVLGQPDFETDNGNTITQASLAYPNNVLYDPARQWLFVSAGMIFAGQGEHRVKIFDLSGGITNGMDAAYELGQPDFLSGTSFQIDTDYSLTMPTGMAYDPGNHYLYVADTLDNRIMIFDTTTVTDGEAAVHVLWTDALVGGNHCGSACQFGSGSGPMGLALDLTTQRLFVADSDYYRVLVFDVNTITDGENAINVLGQPDFTTVGSWQLGINVLDGAWNLFFDSGNNLLYVADWGSHTHIFDVASITDGEGAVDLLGDLDENNQPVFDFDATNNNPGPQGMNNPEAITMDKSNHRLFVSDGLNNRVLVYNLDVDNKIASRTASYVLGQPNAKTTSSAITQTGLNHPSGLVFAPDSGLLYVADSGNNRVMIWNVGGAISNGMPASYVLGQNDSDNSGSFFDTASTGSGLGDMYTPRDVDYDLANQRLFVADEVNNRVLVFSVASLNDGQSAIFQMGDGDASYPPQPGTIKPWGVTYDSTHTRLFVADHSRNRVIVYDLSAGLTTTQSNVLGQPDFTTYGPYFGAFSGDPSSASINFENCGFCVSNHHMAIDEANDHLYVPDIYNRRVLIFDTNTISDGEGAIDLMGQDLFTERNAYPASDYRMGNMEGLFYNPDDTYLYVADSTNNRILIFGLTPSSTPTPTPTPTPTSGGFNSTLIPDGADSDFIPERISVNDESTSSDDRNVIVKLYASFGSAFSGTVTVLLSNDPDFATYAPFTYAFPTDGSKDADPSSWPKQVPWDLCYGLAESKTCSFGRKTVYARFYVNTDLPVAAWTSLPVHK